MPLAKKRTKSNLNKQKKGPISSSSSTASLAESFSQKEAPTTNGKSKKSVSKIALNGAAANGNKSDSDKEKSPVPSPINKSMEKINLSSTECDKGSVNNQTINNDTMMTAASDYNDLTVNTTSGTLVGGTHLPELSNSCIDRGTTLPGYCLAVGENLSNQLGLGCEVDDRKKPQIVKDLPKNIIQAAAGGMHSAVLTQDGIVYTFGCNDEYALGRENCDEEIGKVDLPEKSIEITTGDSHTAALSESGIVYAWGTFRDGSGVLGLENKKIAKIPMKFKLGDKKVVKISSGADHLVFLTTTGEVFTAGNSEHGQLGRISKYNSCRGGRRGCDMILEPGLVRFGKRKELQGHRQIEDIWATSYCTFLKVKDSDLTIGFGLNNCFQLGIDDSENRYQPEILTELKFEKGARIKKVIGGMHHTLFLDTNGFVYSMGSHRYGCLGLGKSCDSDVKSPQKINELEDIVDIAANTNVSYAVHKNGKVYNWGTNYSKQLGQDTEDDYLVPTLVNSKQLDVRSVYMVSIGGQHSLLVASEEKDEESDQSM